MKIIRHGSRILIALVFLFSGFVKAVDPLGTAYKFTDYFEAFHMGFMEPFSLILAMALIMAEFLMGFALLCAFRMRFTAWVVLIFMTFFTLITFKLAISDPVSDCGCFGDALILTNWQTFWKNIVILILVFIVFATRKRFQTIYLPLVEWLLIASFAISIILFSLYNYRHLPIIDFRPYKIGTHIPQKMMTPPNAPMDEYRTVLIYEKDGIQQEFTEQNFPWQDSSWKWIETKQKLIKKGYEPPIHDFEITSAAGKNLTDQILYDDGYTLLLVAYDINKADTAGLRKASELAFALQYDNIKFYGLTSSLSYQVDSIRNIIPFTFEFCTMDAIPLKTMIRSNPGLIMLKKGTVVTMWHFTDIPDASFFKEPYVMSNIINWNNSKNENQLITISILAFMLLIIGGKLIFDRFFRQS